MPTHIADTQTKYGTGLPLGFTSIVPGSGSHLGGTSVTISGSGFLTDGDGTASVIFDPNGTGSSAVGTVVNDSTITCTAPAHAVGTVDVRIIVLTAQYNIANGFIYA